jgi:uncharacterized protein (DUF433 family)
VSKRAPNADIQKLNELISQLTDQLRSATKLIDQSLRELIAFRRSCPAEYLVGESRDIVFSIRSDKASFDADRLAGRIDRMLSVLELDQNESWSHLAPRPDSWRRQYYLKDRNMTVRQLVGRMRANNWSVEQAASELNLPEEAIQEAVDYYDRNQELINLECALENYFLAKKGPPSGPRPVPG